MTLDPNARISQAEQDTLLALLATATGQRTALDAAERNLDTFIRDRLTSDVGMLFDIKGDGELRPVSECVRWGGRSPNTFSAKKREQREHGAHPPPTPPPPVSAGKRAQARAFWNNRQRAQERFSEAGHALNSKINILGRRDGCRTDFHCDVFGDGLYRKTVDCTWPAGVSLYKGKLLG